jgi:hypothetical protein
MALTDAYSPRKAAKAWHAEMFSSGRHTLIFGGKNNAI